jgi:phytanoyl-CoA hydroxylase
MSPAETSLDGLVAARVASAFSRDGFVIVRGLCAPPLVAEIRAVAQSHLSPLVGPAEFEADVGYAGSPANRDALGGDTPRRLLHAYARHEAFRDWATGAAVGGYLSVLLGSPAIALSQSHHNCVMTKYPGFSSVTLWHQDIRYWSFDRSELISAWLALGPETQENGALKIIPGSHNMAIERGRLDRDLFLRPELPENADLIDAAISVELEPGDVIFFSCNTFHAAGKNLSDRVKLSFVTTYHTHDNHPIPNTRSAQYPSAPVQLS